jgi:sec-independent protein translocase protein TatA
VGKFPFAPRLGYRYRVELVSHIPVIFMHTLFSTPLAGVLGLGGPEMILLFVAVLLLFGAKKLPELARGMGKSLGEFKKAREEFESEIKKGGDGII